MRSAYDEVFAALEDNDFGIPNVNIRVPFDESPKEYPLIVVTEIVNTPLPQGTVNGEVRTLLSYQLDIQTQTCLDDDSDVLSRDAAGRLLVGEVSDLLDEEFKLTRRTIQPRAIAADILSNIWRGDCVLDSHGYSYRPMRK